MKASTVGKILIEEVICRHSAPRELLSDQGAKFMSEVIQQVCKYFKIHKMNTVAYRPQTNGLTEKFNGTLCKMLAGYCNEHQNNWDIYLPIVFFANRMSVQIGLKKKLRIDLWKGP